MVAMDMSLGHLTLTASNLRPPSSVPAERPATPTVFVVDEDASVRDSLGLLVDRAGWHAETFASAGDFLARPRVSAPGCLVLDAELSDVNGLEMQQRLAGCCELPIIFLSRGSDVLTAVRAMKAGALEFLTKPLADELLLGALRCAIERSGAELARRAALDALQLRYGSLSCRERQVMALVVCGLLNKQVAAELGISEITVKAHRGKVMRKMAARTLPDLVNMGARLFPAA
jgi:FixJ family two-component response regulator